MPAPQTNCWTGSDCRSDPAPAGAGVLPPAAVAVHVVVEAAAGPRGPFEVAETPS